MMLRSHCHVPSHRRQQQRHRSQKTAETSSVRRSSRKRRPTERYHPNPSAADPPLQNEIPNVLDPVVMEKTDSGEFVVTSGEPHYVVPPRTEPYQNQCQPASVETSSRPPRTSRSPPPRRENYGGGRPLWTWLVPVAVLGFIAACFWVPPSPLSSPRASVLDQLGVPDRLRMSYHDHRTENFAYGDCARLEPCEIARDYTASMDESWERTKRFLEFAEDLPTNERAWTCDFHDKEGSLVSPAAYQVFCEMFVSAVNRSVAESPAECRIVIDFASATLE